MSSMQRIDEQIKLIQSHLQEALKECSSSSDIEVLKVKYLGKKGLVQSLMSEMKGCTPEERPLVGKLINELKDAVTEQLEAAMDQFETDELVKRLEAEVLDVTLPGRRRFLGKKHVTLAMLDEAIDILASMGFSVQYGPDIETDYYNFEALNFPPDHPARDMHDTYYLTPELLLRTHTSNTQVRVMEKNKPPIRVIAPGKCYRNEDVSARSHVMFHQIEGLYIDKDVTFADLLSTLEEFFGKLLKREELPMRFRPSYFPFVEPGVEVDIHCIVCDGKGCNVCKQSGWLEVAGAGMVHPEVLKNGGIDPEEYNGFAWGFGIERLTMLRFGIKDIRLFLEDDLRFLRQF